MRAPQRRPPASVAAAIITIALLWISGTPGTAAAAPPVCTAGNGAADPVVAEIEAIVAPHLGDEMPGIAVAVVTPTPGDPTTPTIQLVNCGMTARASFAPTVPVVPVSASTTWELGSETKLFTAAALAQMDLAGEVRLGDDVQGSSPVQNVPWSTCPQSATPPHRQMQLRDLVTHSSGLNTGPGGGRDPENLTWTLNKQARANYTQTDLWQSFTSDAPGTVDTQESCAALKFDPGASYQYSNWGFGLLGTILANRHAPAVGGVPAYGQLIEDLVTGPLWMNETGLETSHPSTLATPTCEPVAQCYFDNTNAFAGAGGLTSTIGDMGTFVAANLGFNPNPQVTPALVYTHQLAYAGPNEQASTPDGCSALFSPGCKYQGMAWSINESKPEHGFPFRYLDKDGSTNGMQSHTYLMPEACFGLSLTSNATGSAAVNDIGEAVAKLYFPPPPAQFTPCGSAPSAPIGPHATAGKESATVSWSPPSDTGGSPVLGYIVEASPGGSQCATATGTTCTVEGLVAGTSYTFAVHAFNARGAGDAAGSNAVTPWSGAAFHAVVPFRALDSRTATGGWNGPVVAGTPRSLTLAGVGPVPAHASAVVMNVTATGSTANSFLTVSPAGIATPDASNLNFAAGETIPNLVKVGLGAGGAVDIATAVGSTDVVADVVGYYDEGTGELFNGIVPARLLDSRTANGGWNGKLAAGEAGIRPLTVVGRGGVPATASSVVLNVTATNATAASFVQVWPTGATRPEGSNLNFDAGQTIPNLVTAKVGAGGQVSFFNAAGATDITADVVGYFDATGSRFHPAATPARVLDDRNGTGLDGPWGPAQTRTLPVAGGATVPAGATALVLNTTVTGATSSSLLTVFPSGVTRPTTSSLNFGAGQTIANLVIVQLPAAGSIDLYNQAGSVDVIGDVQGWFAPH